MSNNLVASRPRNGTRTSINIALLVWAGLVPVSFQSVSLVPSELRWSLRAVVFIGALALIVVQVVRSRRDAAAIATTDDDVNDLRIAVKESFLPVATLLAEMPNQTPDERKHQVERVADKATSVLAHLLLRHIPRVRANVYALNRANTELHPIGSAGAGDAPRPFRAGGPASAENIAWVIAGGTPRHVPRARSTAPAEGGRADANYDSYISVVIRSGPYSYGMLTVDSQASNPFSDTDVETVKAVAELLAVGLATAFPGESAGSSE